MSKRRSGLLTVISILFIIGGVFAVILAIIGGIGGTMVALAGFAAAGITLSVVIFISCLGGILQFAAGVMGASQKNLGGCKVIGIIILILQIISFILYVAYGSFNWFYLVSLILPILYLVGVSIAKSRRS